MFSIHSKEKHINIKGRIEAFQFKLNISRVVSFKSSVNHNVKFRRPHTWASLLNLIVEVLKCSFTSTPIPKGREQSGLCNWIHLNADLRSPLVPVLCAYGMLFSPFMWHLVLSSCHAWKCAQVPHPGMHRKRACEQQPEHPQEVIVMCC